jgi:hypothetical protein
MRNPPSRRTENGGLRYASPTLQIRPCYAFNSLIASFQASIVKAMSASVWATEM